jgi:hypothetical protein
MNEKILILISIIIGGLIGLGLINFLAMILGWHLATTILIVFFMFLIFNK